MLFLRGRVGRWACTREELGRGLEEMSMNKIHGMKFKCYKAIFGLSGGEGDGLVGRVLTLQTY